MSPFDLPDILTGTNDFKNTSNIKKPNKQPTWRPMILREKRKKKQSLLNENKNLKFIMWSLREREQVYDTEKVQGYNNKNTDWDEAWIVQGKVKTSLEWVIKMPISAHYRSNWDSNK